MKLAGNIVLVGFMGAGKTTLGKALAFRLEMGFIDLDDWIVEQEGKRIPEIFAEQGEPAFRRLEREALHKLLEAGASNTILATGGGTPCQLGNMELLKEIGTVVYLKSSSKELANRLAPYKANRPLIRDLTSEELPVFIHQKLSIRESYYEQADIVLENAQLEDLLEITKSS